MNPPCFESRGLRNAACLGLLAALGACMQEAPSGAAGAYVDVHVASDDTELCAGTVAHLDRYVERVFEFLGEPIPADFVVPIEIGGPESPCEGIACHKDGRVWIVDFGALVLSERPAAVLRHELTHAVHARVWGLSVPFFNEGLAVSLASTGEARPGAPQIGDMLAKPALEVDYGEAGKFVRFLIDTRGLPRFKKVVQGATGRSAAGLRAWFGEVYDEPFEDIEAEYESGELRCLYQLHLCDTADAEQVGDAWYLTIPASCQDAEFYGVATAEGQSFATRRTLELVQGGRYLVSSDFIFDPLNTTTLAARASLFRCGTCEGPSLGDLKLSDGEYELPAGTYSLEIVMPFDTVVSFGLTRLGDLTPARVSDVKPRSTPARAVTPRRWRNRSTRAVAAP